MIRIPRQRSISCSYHSHASIHILYRQSIATIKDDSLQAHHQRWGPVLPYLHCPDSLRSPRVRGRYHRDWGDFNRKPSGYFVAGAIFGATDGVDANELMGVLVVLINARGVWEDNRRGNVLLVVKMRERRQRTGRRNRSE